MDLQRSALEQIQNPSLCKESLTDLKTVHLPQGDSTYKMKALLSTMSNPYLFRVGDVAVCVAYSDKSGDTLQGLLTHLLKNDI